MLDKTYPQEYPKNHRFIYASPTWKLKFRIFVLLRISAATDRM